MNSAFSDGTVAEGQAIGVVAALDTLNQPVVQIGGPVTLTLAQWAAITSTIGLIPGATYYVDTSAHPGRLTAVAPTTGNKVQIGVALSTTQLVISPFLQKLS